MKPYYENENGKLYHGDCLEIIPELEKVDLVLTDPPYSEKTHQGIRTNKGGGSAMRGMTQKGKFNLNFNSLTDDEFKTMCVACLSISKGWVVMTCDHLHAPLMFKHKAFVRLGAWMKNNPMPQISADRPGQGHEAVLILHSGVVEKRWARGGSSAIWRTNVCRKALIPTQKPTSLIISFIQDFSLAGDVVLDPHLSSGTTAVACEELNRKWIGIEISEEHCEIAAKRIETENRQLKMF